MKKIKWIILTSAILVSFISAFASRPHALQSGLYYFTGAGYLPAGQMGVTYYCATSASTCTWTYRNGVYSPYQTAASYEPIQVTNPSPTKPEPKKKSK